MPTKQKKAEAGDQMMQITQIKRMQVVCHILGTTPLVMNRMPKKAREHLLLPPRRKNKAELQARLKHDPVAEFQDSVYRCRETAAPTLIHLPTGCFKKAIAQAAIDIPGATKAQIGRLVSVADVTVHLYGKPFLYMDVVRLAGPSHAPDIRTRAMFKEWACKVNIGYIKNLITEGDLINLFAAAGVITGIGDGRTEKGSRDNGQWELVGANHPAWKAIVGKQARAVQEQAMRHPEPVDLDSEELLAWYQEEVMRREQEPPSSIEADEIDEEEDDDEIEVVAPVKPARRRRGDGSKQEVLT